jgi:copper chaperone
MNTTSETTLDVTGMSCGSCVRHVSAALSGLDGVTRVDVRLKEGKVVIHHDPTMASAEAMIAALDKAGYGSRLSAAA